MKFLWAALSTVAVLFCMPTGGIATNNCKQTTQLLISSARGSSSSGSHHDAPVPQDSGKDIDHTDLLSDKKYASLYVQA